MQAYTTVRLLLAIALGSLLATVGCDWQPIARPVQPERLSSDNVVFSRKLDEVDRYVLLRNARDEEPLFTVHDLRARKACSLPKNTQEVGTTVAPPSSVRKDTPFLLPLMVAKGKDKRELYLATPDCRVEGPFGGYASKLTVVPMDDDQRGVLLWRDEGRTLHFLDPWRDEQREIAHDVETFSMVQRPTRSRGPVEEQAVWVIEGRQLTQRTLLGEERLRMGKAVTTYTQATFDTLRIAFIDNGDAYEAAGPNFHPFLVRQDACDPRYYGTTLNVLSPCKEKQLVRFDLLTGTVEEFPKGVFWAYSDSGVLLEYANNGDQQELYVTPPRSEERIKVEPTLYNVQVINANNLVGITRDRSFGQWNRELGFTAYFHGVVRLTPFIDIRSGQFVWLMLHEEKSGLGDLSVINQERLEYETVARSVPSKLYSVEYLDSISEPIVVSIEDVDPEHGKKGALRARFLSGELPSTVDSDVSSYVMLAFPLPGLLYTINEGPRRGLWFAAL